MSDTAPVVVTADAIAHGGEAVCRHEGLVVFVPGMLPGETASVDITMQKKSFARGRIAEILTESPHRRDVACPAAAAGAGCCDLSMTTSAYSRELKAGILRDQLRRLGGLSDEAWTPLLDDVGVRALDAAGATGGQDEMARWRTVARWHSDARGRIGVRQAAGHHIVTEARCTQVVPEIDAAVERIERAGAPRDAEIVLAAGVGGEVAAQWRPSEAGGRRGGQRGRAQRRRAQAATVGRWAPLGSELGVPAAVGRALDHELMPPWIWHLEASAFWQPHRRALSTYAGVVREATAALIPDGGTREAGTDLRIWDLYAGVGALGSAALDAATSAGGRAQVTAVETATSAVTAGQDTARRIGADLDLTGADVGKWLAGAENVMPDLVITDPPRAGLGHQIVRAIAAAEPAKVVHIGCDIASFARDIGEFVAAGFTVDRIEGIDAFPGTHHLEAVAVLTGRGR